jgi:hypothetical protein
MPDRTDAVRDTGTAEGVPNIGQAGAGDGLGLPGHAIVHDAGTEAEVRQTQTVHHLKHDAATQAGVTGAGQDPDLPGDAIVHDASAEANTADPGPVRGE